MYMYLHSCTSHCITVQTSKPDMYHQEQTVDLVRLKYGREGGAELLRPPDNIHPHFGFLIFRVCRH